MDSDKDSGLDPTEDNVFRDINILGRTLSQMDERGLVLSLAAFAEDALGSLLKAFMLPTATTAQLVDGFNAPLGNFSSRIKAAYSLGLVTKEQFDDLEQLRKIRNYFAHAWQPIGFDDQRIAGHIRSLRFSSFGEDFPESPKEKLRSSIYSLLVALNSVTNRIAEKGGIQLKGYDLITGFTGEFEEQIEEVTKLFDKIALSLETSSGERYAFDCAELQRLQSRLRLMTSPKTDAQHSAVLLLRKNISARLAQR
ncbi:MltR family transcriptional regulator [Pseudomonas fluorescens]|uniref:MltR family transcriptional regulator n=1 Tax=Pseudomonas fluorescens TaxID=294 RepID=UPI000281C903|nr:MltR family transcriptional regulator [Pseudomonas fluorescens]